MPVEMAKSIGPTCDTAMGVIGDVGGLGVRFGVVVLLTGDFVFFAAGGTVSQRAPVGQMQLGNLLLVQTAVFGSGSHIRSFQRHCAFNREFSLYSTQQYSSALLTDFFVDLL